MKDLFYKEQQIYDRALSHLYEVRDGAPCSSEEFEALVDGYDNLLKQVRRMTKLADKTTTDLNISKLELLAKVNNDMLTGLYNRRYMENTFKGIIKSLSRVGGVLSVLMLDIDFFKQYNDTYGHRYGGRLPENHLKTVFDLR